MKKRLELIDAYRGITIISMILFHACWIMGYFGILISSDIISTKPFVIWEKTICCSFIFISGYVFCLGKRHIQNGLVILSLGIAITIGSLIFMYEVRDIFGVLWILGLFSLLTIPIDRLFKKASIKNRWIYIILFSIAIFLLVVFWNINSGYIGIHSLYKLDLPRVLYNGYIMTFIGFMDPSFYSVDYFSIFPWIFLYLAGFFAYHILEGSSFEEKILTIKIPLLGKIGKHSLIIYLIHPVLIFIICELIVLFR